MKFSLTKTKCAVTLLIWVFVYLSIMPTQFSNYVLCIGEDGHIAFEVSIDGRCTHTHAFDSEHAEVSHREIAMETGHCGSCIDLAIFPKLDIDLHLVSANDAPTYSHVLLSVPPAHQKQASAISKLTPHQRTSLLINPTLIYLRTTTLLI